METVEQRAFHSLKRSEKAPPYSGAEFSDIEGIGCLTCKEDCVGFVQHRWRRSCSNCKCSVWKHNIPSWFVENPLVRMCFEEVTPPLVSEYERANIEGYEWFPRDLVSSKVEEYMMKFPEETVPRIDSEGANYRARLILYQIPKQDFNTRHARFLEDPKSQKSFEEMKKRMVKNAVGIGAVKTDINEPTICSGCTTTIDSGDSAIIADRFDSSHAWHPQCFKCCMDNENLVDLIYFCWDKKLFCARHFGEEFKPRCTGCEELIYVGEYTKAMTNAWHIEHFCCWQCDSPLTTQKYVIINDNPFCHDCYISIVANTCHMCQTLIGPESKDLFIKDRHFHDTCLVCIKCQTPLEDLTFSFVNDQPICHDCRGIDPERIQYCHFCAKEFENEERKVGLRDQYYHEECFLCSQCNKKIGSQKFIRKSDGRKLCNDCFKETAKTCDKCEDLIKGSTIRFEEKYFHPECFVCTLCTKELGGVQFYKFDEAPFCEECYLRNHAKKCACCREPIAGNRKYIDYDDQFWHSVCFCCIACQDQLAGRKFVLRDGNKFCLECKEKTVELMV